MLRESVGRTMVPSPGPEALSRLHYLSKFFEEWDQLLLQTDDQTWNGRGPEK